MRPTNLLLFSSIFTFACSGDITVAPIEKGSSIEESSEIVAEENGEGNQAEIDSNISDQAEVEGGSIEEETEEEITEGDEIEDDEIENDEIEDVVEFEPSWYVYDDGQAYDTTFNPNRIVEFHGDPDLYWYEPSGVHGLLESSNPLEDFEILREYVIDGAGEPEPTTEEGSFSYFAESTLSTFDYATFTYFLCDFYPDASDNTSYFITAEGVDDGVQVLFNGEILGYHTYGEGTFAFPLNNLKPGERNTIIITLVDDSKYEKGIENLKFLQSGLFE